MFDCPLGRRRDPGSCVGDDGVDGRAPEQVGVDWTTTDMAADVHAVVVELGLRRPAIVGLSMGGTIALLCAGLSGGHRRGRRSGRPISFPVVLADYQGDRYLVAMLGEGTNWVSNVRAAGGDAVLRHGRREAVRLEEVDPGARAPILRRYLQVAPGGRPHIPVDRRAPWRTSSGSPPDTPCS